MTSAYKVKVESLLDNGDKLGFEAHVEAQDYQSAVQQAKEKFTQAVKSLSQKGTIEAGKIKVEYETHLDSAQDQFSGAVKAIAANDAFKTGKVKLEAY